MVMKMIMNLSFETKILLKTFNHKIIKKTIESRWIKVAKAFKAKVSKGNSNTMEETKEIISIQDRSQKILIMIKQATESLIEFPKLSGSIKILN